MKISMMRRRNDDLSIPMTTIQPEVPDGSGRAIHMDAPIVRAAKNSSTFTRVSYIWVLLSALLIWWAWVDIHFHDASTYLNCDGDECTVIITPPERVTSLKLQIAKEQIIDSMDLMVYEDGTPVIPIQTMKHHHHFHNKHKHHEGDREEHESYAILLKQNGKHDHDNDEKVLEHTLDGVVPLDKVSNMEKYGSAAMTDPALMESFVKQKKKTESTMEEDGSVASDMFSNKKRADLPNLDVLKNYAEMNTMGEYVLIMRRYNIGHTKRRVKTLVSRIKQYANNHRQKVIIREKRTVRWQGILGVVFGMFSLLLSLMAGQFSDPRPNFGGPGSTKRRRKTNVAKSNTYGGY